MVAAGLTAATPHMISASINALSRLLFEFKGMCISTTSSSDFSIVLEPALIPRLNLDLYDLRISSNNNRIPSIQEPRNRQVGFRFRKSRHSRSTHRRNYTPPSSPRTRFTGLGT